MAVSAGFGAPVRQGALFSHRRAPAELHNKGYRWQHEAVIAFAAPQRAFELSQEEAEEWYRGRDVYPQTAPGQDETIVTFRAFRWAGEARRLPTEEQLSARTGARWKTFAGKV